MKHTYITITAEAVLAALRAVGFSNTPDNAIVVSTRLDPQSHVLHIVFEDEQFGYGKNEAHSIYCSEVYTSQSVKNTAEALPLVLNLSQLSNAEFDELDVQISQLKLFAVHLSHEIANCNYISLDGPVEVGELNGVPDHAVSQSKALIRNRAVRVQDACATVRQIME